MEQKTEKKESFFFVCDDPRRLVFCDDVVYAVIVGPVLSEINELSCSCKRADLQRPVVSRLIILGASFTESPSEAGDNCVSCDNVKNCVSVLLSRLLSVVRYSFVVVWTSKVCSSSIRFEPLVLGWLFIV